MGIIEQILQWPVIIQGAIGSALFTFVLYLGQKLTNWGGKKLGSDKDVANFFAKAFVASEMGSDLQIYAFHNSIYGCVHYFIKASLVLTLSMLLGLVIPLFEYIGYLMAVYFLFRSLSYVPHFNSFPRGEELEKEVWGKES